DHVSRRIDLGQLALIHEAMKLHSQSGPGGELLQAGAKLARTGESDFKRHALALQQSCGLQDIERILALDQLADEQDPLAIHGATGRASRPCCLDASGSCSSAS